jgi:hypothetical protein
MTLHSDGSGFSSTLCISLLSQNTNQDKEMWNRSKDTFNIQQNWNKQDKNFNKNKTFYYTYIYNPEPTRLI